MCLDLLKESSDDAFYTEDHVLFLVKKMRAFLLEKKYKRTRNSPFVPMSEENKQRVCFGLEPADDISVGCNGQWLKSKVKVPELMPFDGVSSCTVNDVLQSMVTFIPKERMPYVGYNKWLRNIIYATRSVDGYIYMSSSNPQFMFLEKAGITGVYADPEAAIRANMCNGDGSCADILDEMFPLEASLIPSCVELVVQELSGSKFMPQDTRNNAKDDFSTGTRNNADSEPQRQNVERNEQQ